MSLTYAEFTKKVMPLLGVAGTGLSFKTESTVPVIKVYLEKPVPYVLPKEYKGIKVEYVVTGPCVILSLMRPEIVLARTGRWRPPPGLSIFSLKFIDLRSLYTERERTFNILFEIPPRPSLILICTSLSSDFQYSL